MTLQVFQCYHHDETEPRCDAHWLVDYGFIPAPPNSSLVTPAGCVSLGLRLNDKLASWKRDLLPATAAAEARLQQDGLPGAATTRTLRVAMAEHPDDILPENVPFGGSSEDLRPLQLLKQAVGNMLAKLSHYEVEEDVKTLQKFLQEAGQGAITNVEAVALSYRVREKVLLENALKKFGEVGRNLF